MSRRSTNGIIGMSSFPGKLTDYDEVSDSSSNLSSNIQIMHMVYNRKSQHSELSGLVDAIKDELSFIVAPNNLLVFLLYLLLWICSFLLGLQSSWELEVTQPVYCQIKELENVSWSLHQILNITSPKNADYRQGCTYFDYNYDNLANLSYEEAKDEISNMEIEPKIMKCKNYTVSGELAGRTSFADDFGLTCSIQFWQQRRTYFGLGAAIFQIPIGFFADIYGRKPVYICTVIVLTISSFMTSISPNLGIFVFAYCTVGVSLWGTFSLLIVIFSEIFKHTYRDFMTICTIVAFEVGMTTSKVINPLVIQWRLQNLSYAIGTLILLAGITFVPESPSFLTVNLQYKSAWDTLHQLGSKEMRTLARNTPFAEKRITNHINMLKRPYFYRRLCISVILLGIVLVILPIFESITIIYIVPSKLLIVQLMLMKIINVLIISVLATAFSKKSLICSIYLILAICFLMTHFVQSDHLEDAIVVMSKSLLTALFAVTLTNIIEIFPTTHRCTAFSLNLSLSASIALLYLYHRKRLIYQLEFQTVNTLYFSICMMCAFVSLLGPRTYDDLPDTKDDLVSENAPEDFSIGSTNS